MKHPNDAPKNCPECGEVMYPSHYDDGPNDELYTPMWVCTSCLGFFDVEDLEKENG